MEEARASGFDLLSAAAAQRRKSEKKVRFLHWELRIVCHLLCYLLFVRYLLDLLFVGVVC
jgi:hypothetical protein